MKPILRLGHLFLNSWKIAPLAAHELDLDLGWSKNVLEGAGASSECNGAGCRL